MKFFFLFLCSVFYNYIFSQTDSPSKTGFFQKLSKADTVKEWFRFAKNTHSISFLPAGGAVGIGKTYKNASIGAYLAYDYFPIKRWSIGVQTVLSQGFNKGANPTKDGQFAFTSAYYFYGKNKGFFYPFLEIMNKHTTGISNLAPKSNLNGITGDGQKFHINTLYAGYGFGAGLNIFNNMTFQIWYHNLRRIDGDKNYLRADYLGLSFTYYFRKDQLPHSKKPIKDWFKSDRPKRTHAERKEQERKQRLGY